MVNQIGALSTTSFPFPSPTPCICMVEQFFKLFCRITASDANKQEDAGVAIKVETECARGDIIKSEQ